MVFSFFEYILIIIVKDNYLGFGFLFVILIVINFFLVVKVRFLVLFCLFLFLLGFLIINVKKVVRRSILNGWIIIIDWKKDIKMDVSYFLDFFFLNVFLYSV